MQAALSDQLKKYLCNTGALDQSADVFSVVDIDDGCSILVARHDKLATHLLDHPNLFVGVDHLLAIYYPPRNFCTNCR